MTIFILDACALIAYFSKENGAENIKEIFKQAIDSNAKIYMSKVNLLEVYYDTIKKGNEKNADKMLKIVEQMPIEIIHEISDTVLKKAGLLKSKYRISLADSIALAETITQNGTLITSDHHEFEIIEQ
ncbi:MAG: type II toxin-antitoxin system VapC family toxin, partial [Firmicutes bacterium]|nr:type II toxin-antitoxin system VapC family toxin [Bacillota bacterium]